MRKAFLFALVFNFFPICLWAEEDPNSARNQARQHAAQGREFYESEQYEQALTEYQAAYDLAPAPGVLFNMGQCYRHLGDLPRALTYYERYLSDAPEARNREAVEELIELCRAELSDQSESTDPEETDPTHQEDHPDASVSLDADLQTSDQQPADQQSDEPEPDASLAVDDAGDADSMGYVQIDAGIPRDPDDPPDTRPFYQRWWFWTIVGGVLTFTTVSTVIVSTRDDPGAVLPQGSLGTLDGRGWQPTQ